MTEGDAGSFHGKIRKFILDRGGLTQVEGGKLFGISPTYAGKIIDGKAIPSGEVVIKIADAIGVDRSVLLWLASRDAAPPEARRAWEAGKLLPHLQQALASKDSTPPGWLPGKEEDQIVQMMRSLPLKKKQRIVQLVKAALGLAE